MSNLKFRRQFLLSPHKSNELEQWQTEKIDDYFLYVHPDCQFHKMSGVNDVFLIGYFLDPHHPEKKPSDILEEFSQQCEIEVYFNILYKLIGRFILIIKVNEDLIFFNDACGLKSFFFTKKNGKIYAGSQPLLIDKVTKLTRSSSYYKYFNSKYVARNKEHYIPSGISLFENVFQLAPNHYLRLSNYKQRRYWPNSIRREANYSNSQMEFSHLLRQIMKTAHNHLDLAIALTAGWDSRMILSSTKGIHQDLMYYTLRYRKMTDKHNDIKIPESLSKSLNLNHHIFECQFELPKDFEEIYTNNSDMAHIHDWGKIAYGMYKTYPQEKVAVKGNCSEIGRCAFHWGKEEAKGTSDDFVIFQDGWSKLDFIKKRINDWYNDVKQVEIKYGYDPYDLFFWEHRMGSWQTQSQLEWDIVQEVFTPFNSRELLDLMLSMNTSHRIKKDSDLYKDTMKYLWPEVLAEPFNPVSRNRKIYKRIRPILYSTGILYPLKKIFKK